MPSTMRFSLILAIASLTLAFGAARPLPTQATGSPDRVRLQLKWVPQAQFAGYYAARARGFYAAEGLDVEFLHGGPEISPEEIVAAGEAEIGVNWLPSLLVQREQGRDLVGIAQVFRRSAVVQVAWRDSGITSLAQLRGRRVAVWCCGNQFELYAALQKYGIDPENPADVTIVDQPFDMDLFLRREVDAAAATIYNELAQVLETVNPATGRPYTLDDLTVFSMEDEGVGMLEDGIFARADWLAVPRNQAIAVRFLRASFRGWIACRDEPASCVDATLAEGPALGRDHQRRMMNEVNALIWPSPDGIGLLERAAYERAVEIALRFGVLARPPNATATRTDLAAAALAGIAEDARGAGWRKPVVEVTPGGR